MAEVTRLSFVFDRSAAEVLGPAGMRALTGQPIDVRWGDQVLQAEVEAVLWVDDKAEVMLAVHGELPIGRDVSAGVSAAGLSVREDGSATGG